jgi:predicted methyltransferase
LTLILFAAPVAMGQEDEQSELSPEERQVVDSVVAMFESPERSVWQRPYLVLEVIGVDDAQHVADLGAGSGYFTRLFSEAVGESGKVYAVDTSRHMLDYINQRDDLPYGNVETILAEPDDPKLPPGEIELILVVNTWQYIDDRVNYLGKLEKALAKPGGRVAIIDWRKGEWPAGPPSYARLPRADAIAEFEQAGWKLRLENDALPYQYFLVFTPPTVASGHPGP